MRFLYKNSHIVVININGAAEARGLSFDNPRASAAPSWKETYTAIAVYAHGLLRQQANGRKFVFSPPDYDYSISM